jgi:hypothetical protein
VVTYRHIHSKSEGHHKSITSKRTVTEDDFPSSVWIGVVARGQQSTDSIVAEQSPERATRLYSGGDALVRRYGKIHIHSDFDVDTLSALTSRYHISVHRTAILGLLTE